MARVLTGMRDGASVNRAASIMEVVCFLRLIDNVGPHCHFRVLDVFFYHWVNLFARDFNARLPWRESWSSVRPPCGRS